MSEEDVIREALTRNGEPYDDPAALAALDSLTTRLAEVTNRMHVLQAQLDDSATRLAEAQAETKMAIEIGKQYLARADNAEANWDDANAVNDSLTTRLAEVERERAELAQRIVEADEQDALREQLTQAREALERVRGEVRQHYAACDHDDRPASLALRNVANEALATINEGETG